MCDAVRKCAPLVFGNNDLLFLKDFLRSPLQGSATSVLDSIPVSASTSHRGPGVPAPVPLDASESGMAASAPLCHASGHAAPPLSDGGHCIAEAPPPSVLIQLLELWLAIQDFAQASAQFVACDAYLYIP